ncbi:MAG: glycoside hydrolase family 3 protein, partial [Anaerolineae bacterium]
MSAVLIAVLLANLFLPLARAQQPPDPVAALMDDLTVDEKIGQLFIVPFAGADAGPESDIAALITEFKVGGVVLQSSNGNFTNTADTPRQIAALTNRLQAHTLANKNIPLFIAIDHEGDGWPYTRVTGGVTPIPSAMSIGATWDLQNARAVGQIAGQELSAMGVNMLLGPVLDVLNAPRPTGRGDMGPRTFGGDPFWVGAMGQAYIQGVHEGSNNTIATVAKHFPGHGGSDRLPDDEVATVDKSLQALKRIELVPFFAATRLDSPGPADAIMSSHIRYRGFQGDIRQFTAPISFDPVGMATLLSLPEFAPWRDAGGLIVSDALGVPAVRKHYDPTLQTFPHRRIAREAFLAGNDLLILAQFDLNSIWSNQFENIKDTVQFFRSEYRANGDFAARVDASVARILRLKLKLFPNVGPNALFVDGDVALAVAGQGQQTVNRIARQSLTLLYPTPAEYSLRLPRPPGVNETLLLVT